MAKHNTIAISYIGAECFGLVLQCALREWFGCLFMPMRCAREYSQELKPWDLHTVYNAITYWNESEIYTQHTRTQIRTGDKKPRHNNLLDSHFYACHNGICFVCFLLWERRIYWACVYGCHARYIHTRSVRCYCILYSVRRIQAKMEKVTG